MKKLQRILLLTVVSVLTNAAAFASGGMNFHLLGVKAGMSSNDVQDIEQDQYGFMWFATRDGLNRYDGYQFKTYHTLKLGAYNNNVEWVAEDGAGNVWIKTPVNYCFYDREKDELNNRSEQLLHTIGIPETPDQLYIDEDKNLWAIKSDTLSHYTFADSKLHTLILPHQIQVTDLTCRDNRGYLLAADGSVFTIDWTHRTLTKLFQMEMHYSQLPQIYLDCSRRLWIFVPHHSTAQCYSLEQDRWIELPMLKELENEHTMITSITDDGKGNIWIGTDGRGVWTNGQAISLPDNHVTCIYKDKNDVLWIGTGKQGVAYTNLNSLRFENFDSSPGEDVSCFLEEGESTLWLGFDGEGLARYDKAKDTYTYYRTKNESIPSDLIVCTFCDRQGRIWWGSFGGGAFYWQDGRFSSLQATADDAVEMPQYIRRITQDDDGRLWFATFSQGLYAMDADGGLERYTMENSVLLTDYIADLAYTGGDWLYVATSSGVYRMNTSTREMVLLEYTEDGQEVIHDNNANCIYHDSRGLLWIGGKKGVNVYHPRLDKVVNLNETNGISHPSIRAIAEDASHNIWLTTDHGISQVVVSTTPNEGLPAFRCYPYYEEDGMANVTFNNFSILSNAAGEILAGGRGGYVKVIPRAGEHCPHRRKVVFTHLYIDNEPVIPGKNIQLLDLLELDYAHNSFAVEVSAMDYGNLHKLHYEYRLDKAGKWIKLEGNRIHFTKLMPDTYRLQVRVMKMHGDENDSTATLTIRVHPPIWLSPVAYILYAFIVTGIVVGVLISIKRKHQRVLLRQKHDMEVARQHEMDEAKLRFLTNISHDLRTPLSLIITPLEKMMAADKGRKPREELRLMHRNALALLDVINQLLDLRRLENGKAQLNPSYGDLADFLNDVCMSFQTFGEARDISFRLQQKAESLETDFDKSKMQRILLNLLSNAFKYNVEHGNVTVTLERITREDVEYACLCVADTGIGIQDENKERIFDRFYQEEHSSTDYIGSGIGMHIVKEYVTLHDGTITVRDNHPQGTVFELTFPIRHESRTTLPDDTPEEKGEASVGADTQEATSRLSILVVEDNKEFSHFMANCLKHRFTVYEAEHGRQALEVLSEHDISLVISDVRMPVMDGLELCNRIKDDIRYSHIPVILLTARTAQEHILEGLQEGADDYITKPFNLDILLLRIDKLLQWSRNNHRQFGKVEVSPSQITVSNMDEKLIERAIQIVESHMDNTEFSVEDLSAAVGMSRGHLYKKLTAITGKSPVEFIRILRIKRGKQLLEQSHENVSQIAYQVGLSPKQFAKYFKEEFGCSPSEYNKTKNQ